MPALPWGGGGEWGGFGGFESASVVILEIK